MQCTTDAIPIWSQNDTSKETNSGLIETQLPLFCSECDFELIALFRISISPLERSQNSPNRNITTAASESRHN